MSKSNRDFEMQSTQTHLYQEVIQLLEAYLECAKSLQASSEEFRDLVQAERFDIAQERLSPRGEIIDMMISFDHRLCEIFTEVKNEPDFSADWQEAKKLFKQIQQLLAAVIDINGWLEVNIQKKFAAITKELKKLKDGRKLMQHYHPRQSVDHHTFES